MAVVIKMKDRKPSHGKESWRNRASARFDGAKLRALREASDLSRKQLASAAGVSIYYVQQLELKPGRDPGISVCVAFCDALQCDLWDLLTDKED